MKIRLFETELGSADPDTSKSFYESILGLRISLDQKDLKVFESGTAGLDFNISKHFDPGVIAVSYLTDDLNAIITNLNEKKVSFKGPWKSHLGMDSIEFKDPDGHIIRVNHPTEQSPTWLKV